MSKEFYQFSLILKNIEENTENLEDRLYLSGCNDSLINYRDNGVYLDFERKGSSLVNAVNSAIHDVESAKIGDEVVSAIVFSKKEYERLIGTNPNFLDFMNKSPMKGLDIQFERDYSIGRDIDLMDNPINYDEIPETDDAFWKNANIKLPKQEKDLNDIEKLLKSCEEKRLTLGAAESCSGGAFSARITQVPGASKVFVGSIVSYSDEIKTKLLDVPEDLLKQYGAVSKEVVLAMLKGALKQLNCDLAVAITGVAGPTGSTKETPVGTVWIAVSGKGFKEVVQEFHFEGKREDVIDQSVEQALSILESLIRK